MPHNATLVKSHWRTVMFAPTYRFPALSNNNPKIIPPGTRKPNPPPQHNF